MPAFRQLALHWCCVMKPHRGVETLFIVGVLLFVAGVCLVVVGARSTRAGTAPATAVAVPEMPGKAVANVRQIMAAIVEPASNTLFNSVGTTITKKGIDEKAPHTDDDWAMVAANAAALAEAGLMLKGDGRAIDRGDWMAMAQAMVDAAHLTLKAVEARSAQGVFDAGGELYTSCDNCHRQYVR